MPTMIEHVKGAIMSSARDCGVSFSSGEVVARAAITAMHEPTPDMCLAAIETGVMIMPAHTRVLWRAMVDAALTEKVTK